MIDKKLFSGMFLLAAIVFFSGFFSAYMTSNPAYFPYSSYGLQSVSQAVCQPGQDFVIQISPFGCTPAVVRSDLLEENDVPVLCQLGALKTNPLVDINSIDSISFSGKSSPQVSGVGFYPAKAALGTQGNFNNPTLDNIGYVVIMLKKQPNASAMPDYVTGNLTASIKYNIDNAFGIGNVLFYLPQFASDSEWQAQKYSYSFWNGKGYLKADDITANTASISIYTDSGKASSVNLQVGQTSDSIYLPGLQCQAGLKLTLNSLDNSNTRANLRVNADVTEVIAGEKFLDNKCSVLNLQNNGVSQKVTISCREDTGTNTFDLTISPNVTLNIDGKDNSYGLGDWLYNNGNNGVYLGYIGTNGNLADIKNLFVLLISEPQQKARLTNEELASISSLVHYSSTSGIKMNGLINQVSDAMKSAFGFANSLGRYVASGQAFYGINFNDRGQTPFGKPVYISGFSMPQDAPINSQIQEQYSNAKQDYETIKSQYASEQYPVGDTTYGEEALYNEISLASDVNQKATASSLCSEFKKNYPNSKKDLTSFCSDYQLSNEQSAAAYVTINKQVKKISFDGIYEPTFDEYGAVVRADTPKGTQYLNLEKNQPMYLSSSGNDFIQLVSINGDNSSTIQVSVTAPSNSNTPNGINSGIIQLTTNTPNNFASGYTFTLTKVNVHKVAKVSVISNINNAGTKADFSFKISIEQRAIQLSPDEIRKQISDLNKGIDMFQNISDALGSVTQGLKTACIGTGIFLVAKNFLLNAGGAGTARTYIMRGTKGWFDKCTAMFSAKTYGYSSVDDCLLKNSDKIDAEVGNVSNIINNMNKQKKELEAGTTTQSFGEQVVNTNKYMQANVPVVNSYLQNNLPSQISDPNGKGQTIDMNKLLKNVITTDGYSSNYYTSDQLNDIELWARVANNPSSSQNLKDLANIRLYADLSSLQTNAANFAQAAAAASSLGIHPSQVASLNTQKNLNVLPYVGLTNASNNPIAYVQTLPDGNVYKIILDNSKGTSNLPIASAGGNLQIYTSSGTLVQDQNIISQFSKVYFQQFNEASYKNPYKEGTAKVQYYETDPYKGMPAIVPFDLANGWYAATKPVVASAGTNTYEANGRVSSFYVCNIGPDRIPEFQTGGDDTCELINTGTGQPYNQFPGITSETESANIINKANQAIEQARTSYSASGGKIKIFNQVIDVGTPAALVQQFECQDFMSPKDCLLLFNLCDPVICPSSRCNLGGAYPVKDVVQSGIIGSIALCLPNIREGIVMPVCLTGVQAGLDGLLSVQKSYRDCLNESLTTGKMVGICDEVYSIYLCDFFWKQALPIANLAIPKIIETIAGQNVRGGGEYLGVASAWDTAQKSLNYFINSYGSNSRDAFVSRTTSVIQDTVCKMSLSSVLPQGGNLLNTMTQPDSPPQFSGRFDEITFSTATIPPTSQYKVYYHIYSGKDSGASYQVYLKGDASSSYYKDTAQTIMVDSGYVSVGSQVDQTKDILATSGYKNLCINVNGQEECGFQKVSTDFGVNYVTDMYLASQANQTGIKTESGCISGTASAYDLLNPNLQSAAQSIASPSIYNQGIIRVCATADPGQGTDPNSGTANARWKQVGYCDTPNMKCWIDSQSIQNAMKYTTDANATLNSLSSSYSTILQEGYTPKQFSSDIKQIQSAKDADKITLINNIIDKVVLSNEKVQLLFLRGNAYSSIIRAILPTLPKPEATLAAATGAAANAPVTAAPSSVALNIWQVAKNFADSGFDESRNAYSNPSDKYDYVCTRFVLRVMIAAGVSTPTIIDSNVKPGITDPKNILKDTYTNLENMNSLIPIFLSSGDFVEVKDFNQLQKGDLVMLGYRFQDARGNNPTQHFVVFDSYTTDGKSIKAYGDPGEPNFVFGVQTTNPNKVQLETRAINDPKGYYIYRVFRYVGTGAGTVQQTNPANQQATTQTQTQAGTQTQTTPTNPVTTITILTMGEKIWQAAGTLASGNSQDVAATFVSKALTNAGVSGIQVSGTMATVLPSSPAYLASLLSQDSDFTSIDINTVKQGDVVLLGNGCTEPYSVGIVSFVPDTKAIVGVYTNLGNGVKLESTAAISSGIIDDNILTAFGIVKGNYIYKAYRYSTDLNKQNLQIRTPWTLDSAINQVNTLKGNYDSNKIFVDQLIFDGILTAKDCGDVRGISTPVVGQLGGKVLQKDMIWLKKLLLQKKATLGTTQASTYSAQGNIFTISLTFKYENNAWLWSADKTNWMPVTTTIVSGGFWNGQQPTDANKALINALIGKNFDQGKSLLAGQDVTVQTPTSGGAH